jgi:hypothetical protein
MFAVRVLPFPFAAEREKVKTHAHWYFELTRPAQRGLLNRGIQNASYKNAGCNLDTIWTQ